MIMNKLNLKSICSKIDGNYKLPLFYKFFALLLSNNGLILTFGFFD